jgi:hypothetical protein
MLLGLHIWLALLHVNAMGFNSLPEFTNSPIEAISKRLRS